MENTLANEIFNKLEKLDPIAALGSINSWHKAIDEAHQRYAKIHTYCHGCNKLIKVTEMKVEKDGKETVNRCPECGTSWRVTG